MHLIWEFGAPVLGVSDPPRHFLLEFQMLDEYRLEEVWPKDCKNVLDRAFSAALFY